MKNSKELRPTIHCPYCGREYLPCEIFYPDKFLGQETNIERDSLGQVLYYDGKDACFQEQYICDKCENQFIVTADIKFIAEKDDQNNLNKNYFTLKPAKLFLPED